MLTDISDTTAFSQAFAPCAFESVCIMGFGLPKKKSFDGCCVFYIYSCIKYACNCVCLQLVVLVCFSWSFLFLQLHLVPKLTDILQKNKQEMVQKKWKRENANKCFALKRTCNNKSTFFLHCALAGAISSGTFQRRDNDFYQMCYLEHINEMILLQRDAVSDEDDDDEDD